MAFQRKGFVLAKTGAVPPVLKTYKVLATANNAYYLNDAVRMNGNGELDRVSTSSADVLGVVAAVYTNVQGQKKPLTFSQPDRGPYLTSGQAGFAEVIDARDAVFIASIDVSASAGLIGSNVDVTAGAPTQTTGISGMGLKGSTISTTANRTFKIVGISDFETAENGRDADLAANSGVLVKMNNPQLYNTTGF